MAAERPKIRLDEFVAKVVPDPNNAGELLLVNGFLGKSSEEDHTRIYWDASLNTYVDVKDADIVHTESLSKEASPLGGSYVWVKRDAKVYFGAGGQSTKGKFFEGPLMNAYGGQFAGAGAPALGTPNLTNVGCVPTQFCPPTGDLLCLSVVQCAPTAHCVTRTFICVESRICVQSIPCGSAHCIQSADCNSVGCPPPTPACPPPGTPGCGPMTPPNVCPFQAAAGGVAAFAESQVCHIPTKVCTHQNWCYSRGCFPTIELNCDYVQRGAAGQAGAVAAYVPGVGGNQSLVCSYAPGCWFSWDACPTLFGGCGGGGRSYRFCPTI
jgi:hypothetical protein